eukprot:6345032-Pyramimonas_sp.AAC.1
MGFRWPASRRMLRRTPPCGPASPRFRWGSRGRCAWPRPRMRTGCAVAPACAGRCQPADNSP